MAIDVSTFYIDIASGTTVTKGQAIPMIIKDGPSVVRSGIGAALLKRVISFKIGSSGVGFNVEVKNSDWVDPIINDAPALGPTLLDRRTSAYQSGNSCPLTPNSSWYVVAVPQQSGTVSADCSILCTIEVDYPSVSAIVDPDALVGIPCTLTEEMSITTNAAGACGAASWDVVNVDIFKAGYEYALQKANIDLSGSSVSNVAGFVSITNAAGMRGLSRTIPVSGNNEAICMIVEYASKLVKGPMDIRLMLFETTATARDAKIVMDYVKRRI